MRYLSNSTLFAAMLFVGLYFPTSSDGKVRYLYAMAHLISFVFLAALAMRTGCDRKITLWISTPIVLWLIACTFPSAFNLYEVTLIPLGALSLLGFMFSVRAGKLECRDLKPIMSFMTIVNIGLGVGMIAIERVSGFMLTWYSNFYDDLLPRMIATYKPVTTFTTHSLAGVFAYFFFLLNFRTYQKTSKKLYLWLAVLQVIMCIAIMSTTSLIFSAVALAELAYAFKWRVLVFAPLFYFVRADIRETVTDAVTTFWLAEGNGFGARYNQGGTLYDAIEYILHHPFLPTGLTTSHNFATIDSGPLEYLLYGSVPLVVLVYGGLWMFLRRNLLDVRDCYHLFAVILAAEVGFNVLTYLRSFLLIPVFVIYLNSLTAASSAQAVRLESVPASYQGLACPT